MAEKNVIQIVAGVLILDGNMYDGFSSFKNKFDFLSFQILKLMGE